ncbi:Holliday junction branch migration DNA helicase RuvB [Patescibacteria group bacterium]|nr:Holliday junction branch migration DNA helicase RuvB [Patescibacteria group bacterium]
MIERPDELKEERIISDDASDDERTFEIGLRPKKLTEFIGQPEIKQNLEIFMAAAKKRGEPVEHVLLYGNPGLGKTTLAHVIANETGSQIKVTSGPALERVGDLAAILSNLNEGDILFIDEIHRMNKSIEEVLYPAMEDYALDLIVGKGPTARTLRLDLDHFTIIGATTRISMLSSPLRDRFGVTYRLNFYEEADIAKIINRSAKILNVTADEAARAEIAKRARSTPRIANRLLKRVRDFAEVKFDGRIDKDVACEALNLLDIDEYGLDAVDRRILSTIIKKFNGGPVGLGTVAAATQEEIATLEEVYEPFLMQLGMLNRTPRGREATKRAYEHLNIDPPNNRLKL